MRSQKNVESLVGRRFGRLVVVDYAGADDHYNTKWLCRCDCGREKTASRVTLMNGKTWRCGRNCPIDTHAREGEKFGALTLVRKISESETRTGEKWLCRCECGGEIVTTAYKLAGHNITSCGCGIAQVRATNDTCGVANGTSLNELTGAVKSNNKTGVRGVSKHRDGRFRATIVFRRHKYSLGIYARLEDAKAVREEAERLIWGPALRSSGDELPSHDDCLEIVRDIKRRYAEAKKRRVTEPY